MHKVFLAASEADAQRIAEAMSALVFGVDGKYVTVNDSHVIGHAGYIALDYQMALEDMRLDYQMALEDMRKEQDNETTR